MPTPPQHVCPRCGYDLAGHMATWTESAWPIDGVCSECGLKFEWADVLSPNRSRLAWLYEHTVGRGIGVRRFVRTCFALILPWVFWNRVKLRHVLVPRRLVLWLALLFVPIWAIQAAANNATELVMSSGMATAVFGVAKPISWEALVAPWLWPVATLDSDIFEWRVLFSEWPPVVKAWVGMTIGMPLLLLVLSHSRRLAKVRPMHVWRAAIYSSVWVALPLVARLGFELSQLEEVIAMTSATPRARFGGMQFTRTVESLFLYFRDPVSVAVFAWFALYWLLAITAGLKLERGFIIWLLLMIAAGLLGCLLAIIGSYSEWLAF